MTGLFSTKSDCWIIYSFWHCDGIERHWPRILHNPSNTDINSNSMDSICIQLHLNIAKTWKCLVAPVFVYFTFKTINPHSIHHTLLNKWQDLAIQYGEWIGISCTMWFTLTLTISFSLWFIVCMSRRWTEQCQLSIYWCK